VLAGCNSDRRLAVIRNPFGSLELGIWILPFDLAQGGESFDVAQDHEPVEWPVEPFVICYLELGIF
jgi:hypothetical protein